MRNSRPGSSTLLAAHNWKARAFDLCDRLGRCRGRVEGYRARAGLATLGTGRDGDGHTRRLRSDRLWVLHGQLLPRRLRLSRVRIWVPGEFGRVWRFLGWRGAWPLAWMARQEQLAQSPVWMARHTGQLARRRGWTASRPPGLAPVRIGMWRHYQKNKLVAFAVGLSLAGSVQAQMPQDHLTRQRSHQKQLDLSRDQFEQQQQLNQERLRAERGWQLHPRPQAPWEERRREDDLRKEFPRAP